MTDPTPGEARIARAFKKPGHPCAFSARDNVARHFNVSGDKARKALEFVDSYVLHKEYKRPRSFNPYYVYNLRDMVQADLIDVKNIKRSNDNVSYLLLLIDVFSRRVWLYPMVNKSAGLTREKLQAWIGSLRQRPKQLMTDAGKEFCNAPVRNLLRAHDIEHTIAAGTCKAAYAERANASIQVLIYKYLTDRESVRYIDVLEDLVKSYNKRGHRGIEYFSPLEADKRQNEELIRGINMARWAKVGRKKPRFEPGDLVRIKTDSSRVSSARRKYAEQYKGEYFRIMRTNRRLPVPVYYLKSLDSGQMIDGVFYAEELSRVRGNIFKIERMLNQYRGRRPNRQVLVQFKYFTNPEWIYERDIVARY